MKLLLDVISPDPLFVVIDNNKVTESLHILDKNSTKISDCIQNKFLELQERNNLLNNLDQIIVFTGPGSYTSLRVGISFMLGISYSRNIPIYGLSYIDILCSSIVEKDFNNTILLICSSNNQDYICIPSNRKNLEYKTYQINDKIVFNEIQLNIYSKCISNCLLSDSLKNFILKYFGRLEFRTIQNNFIRFSSNKLKKQSILEPIYISTNKLFD